MARRFTVMGASPSMSPDVAKRMCAFAIEPSSQQGRALSRLPFAANGLDARSLARLELGKQLGPGGGTSRTSFSQRRPRGSA
jgi:hypothetical protein